MDPDISRSIDKFCLVYSFACLVSLPMLGWQAAVAWVLGMAGVAIIVKVVTKVDS